MRHAWLFSALFALTHCDDSTQRASTGYVAARADSKAAPSQAWLCGNAAGVCTCVSTPITAAPAAPLSGNTCAVSECCFEHADSHCSCRLDSAASKCADVMRSLGATRRVNRCPP